MDEMHRTLRVAILNNPMLCWALLWHDAEIDDYDEVGDAVDEIIDELDYGAFIIRFEFDEADLIGHTVCLLTDNEWARLREGRSPWGDG